MMTRFLPLPLFFALYCGPAGAKQLVRVPLPAGFHPATIAVADLDGDHRVDVALCGSAGQLLVLAGELRSVPQSASCGQNPSEMIATDLDGDGRIDLAVANHDTDYITVLHNDGAAHLTAQRLNVHSKPHPHTVAAADLNGDKRIDLIVDSWGENRLTLHDDRRRPEAVHQRPGCRSRWRRQHRTGDAEPGFRHSLRSVR